MAPNVVLPPLLVIGTLATIPALGLIIPLSALGMAALGIKMLNSWNGA